MSSSSRFEREKRELASDKGNEGLRSASELSSQVEALSMLLIFSKKETDNREERLIREIELVFFTCLVSY